LPYTRVFREEYDFFLLGRHVTLVFLKKNAASLGPTQNDLKFGLYEVRSSFMRVLVAKYLDTHLRSMRRMGNMRVLVAKHVTSEHVILRALLAADMLY
jgi:hypothetical protein